MAMSTCVVMATYRGVNFVGQQIESLFKQSVLPDCLVVRDDNSDDGTFEELERLKVLSPFPVTVLRGTENFGFKKNFAETLKVASADIYFFSDQDDVWLPEKIERHLEVYNMFPETLVVISNQEIVGPTLEPSGRTSLDEIRKIRGDDSEFVHGCCTSLNNQLYDIASAPQEGLGHDDWVHSLAQACGQRRVIEKPLQLFRRHTKSTTSSAFNQFDNSWKKKRTAAASQVAANLRRRAAISQSTAAALGRSTGLPVTLRHLGIKNSTHKANRAVERAKNLEDGLCGIFPIIIKSLLGHQTFRTGLADSYRIVSSAFCRNK